MKDLFKESRQWKLLSKGSTLCVGGHSLLFITLSFTEKYFCPVNTWTRWCDITFSHSSTKTKTVKILAQPTKDGTISPSPPDVSNATPGYFRNSMQLILLQSPFSIIHSLQSLTQVQACLALTSLSSLPSGATSLPGKPTLPTGTASQQWPGSNFKIPPQPTLSVNPHLIRIEMAALICQIKKYSFVKKEENTNLNLRKRPFWRTWRLGTRTNGITRWLYYIVISNTNKTYSKAWFEARGAEVQEDDRHLPGSWNRRLKTFNKMGQSQFFQRKVKS